MHQATARADDTAYGTALFTACAAIVALVLASSVTGCVSEAPASGWGGTVDTLSSGHIVVHNPAGSLWSAGEAWDIREELRIGTLDGTGPEMFGDITDFAVDDYGRFWILEGQAQELRVFDASGAFVRTVGRQGEGPGEFNRVIGMDWGPDGHLWIADPSNNRLSVVDTTGSFVASHPTIGGITVMPWPGGFDDAGRFYTYGIDPSIEDDFALVMVRHDSDIQPTDSVPPPDFPGEREMYELRNESSWMLTGVPHTPSLEWRLARDGTYWAGLTGDYIIFQLSWEGDTLRSVHKEYTALPVTPDDMARAREDLEWFVEAGGKVDWSRIPATKPAFEEFVLDDEGNLWVQLVAEGDQENRRFDVFDPQGRYLGEVVTPFPVDFYAAPVIRDGYLYAITEDELEVPFAIRARIDRPAGN